MDVRYAFQQLDDLPAGYAVPEGRVKPWGTSHAILSARDVIDGPFAVINADDYYGPEAFQKIYDYLLANPDRDGKYEYAMVGYLLENTVTENGHVARGICVTNAEGYLDSVTERTHIEKTAAGARFTEDDGATWTDLPGDTIVSMNMWGFTRSFLAETGARFAAFLDNALKTVLQDHQAYFQERFVDGLSIRKYADVHQLNRGSVDYLQKKLLTALAQLLKERDEADGICRLRPKTT